MSGRTSIEWSEITWNPTTGCSKVSAGCKNCYAERWALMQQKRGISQYKNGFELTLAENRLLEPFTWKQNKIVFVNSMSDLFHEKVPLTYIKEVFRIINQLPQHTFQILTKRIDRVVDSISELVFSNNIWLGVSVENNLVKDRITKLKSVPTVIKFISYEPLLEEIKEVDYSNINWVIVGGESGGKARQIQADWIKKIRKQCEDNQIPFFFKQWGKREFNPNKQDETLNKKHANYSKGGCLLDEQLYRYYPSK